MEQTEIEDEEIKKRGLDAFSEAETQFKKYIKSHKDIVKEFKFSLVYPAKLEYENGVFKSDYLDGKNEEKL